MSLFMIADDLIRRTIVEDRKSLYFLDNLGDAVAEIGTPVRLAAARQPSLNKAF